MSFPCTGRAVTLVFSLHRPSRPAQTRARSTSRLAWTRERKRTCRRRHRPRRRRRLKLPRWPCRQWHGKRLRRCRRLPCHHRRQDRRLSRKRSAASPSRRSSRLRSRQAAWPRSAVSRFCISLGLQCFEKSRRVRLHFGTPDDGERRATVAPGWASTTGLDEAQDIVDMKAIVPWHEVPYAKGTNPLDWIAAHTHISAKCPCLNRFASVLDARARLPAPCACASSGSCSGIFKTKARNLTTSSGRFGTSAWWAASCRRDTTTSSLATSWRRWSRTLRFGAGGRAHAYLPPLARLAR